ncbi:hypothetical protein [Lysobacter enzymogenes]|uniref:hypothetical protein n=1 Tax=Lysobacter enzymogenes TaxID=69 RepID=UPI00099D3B28|nr:hypothetical protein [Lysobacter enzymogenes]UZW62898.1 hypothetical protein BV903_011670 [Lysobacter enzymogenes]
MSIVDDNDRTTRAQPGPREAGVDEGWTSWAPAGGWDGYVDEPAVLDAVLDGVSEAAGLWHNMSFPSLSVWEWCADGSAIAIAYRDDRIAGLQTNGGVALEHFLAATAAFGLIARAPAGD